MDRKDFFEFVELEYGIKPDYPFSDDTDTAVFRHEINRKWFAIVMSIPREKLGLSGGGGSGEKRLALQTALGFPGRLSANGFLDALNALFTLEELKNMLAETKDTQ